MPEDASLDDFLAGSDEHDGDDADEARGDAAVEGGDGTREDVDGDTESDDAEVAGPESAEAERVPPGGVDPATTTAAWSSDGAACDACGAVVDYRWQGGPGLVCPDCKEW